MKNKRRQQQHHSYNVQQQQQQQQQTFKSGELYRCTDMHVCAFKRSYHTVDLPSTGTTLNNSRFWDTMFYLDKNELIMIVELTKKIFKDRDPHGNVLNYAAAGSTYTSVELKCLYDGSIAYIPAFADNFDTVMQKFKKVA